MSLPVNPSVSNVLDDESDEQAGDHDSTRCSLVFDALDAIIREEELCMCEELSELVDSNYLDVEGHLHAQWLWR